MQFIQGQGLNAVITELRRLLDRARSPSEVDAASGGRSLWPLRRPPPPGYRGSHTQRKGLRSARPCSTSSPVGSTPAACAPEPGGASSSMLARPLAGGLRKTTGDGKSSGRNRSRTGEHRDRRSDPRETPPAHIGASARTHSSPPASPSSSSAILPGGTQLSSVESGRRAYYRSLVQIG